MVWNRIGTALLCIAAPVGWSLCVLWASTRIERAVLRHGKRKGLTESQATLPPLDYHI